MADPKRNITIETKKTGFRPMISASLPYKGDRQADTDDRARSGFNQGIRHSYSLNKYADPIQLYPDSPPISLTIVGKATATIV